MATILIKPLSRRLKTLVDDDMFEELNQYSWNYVLKSNSRGYVSTGKSYKGLGKSGKGKKIYLHRLVLGVPDGVQVDHINRNPLDNRRKNLRICTTQQNNFNTGKKIGRSGAMPSSAYKGVCKAISGRRKRISWTAIIRHGEHTEFLGSFNDEVAAALTFDEAARRIQGEFAFLNFPDGPPVDWVEHKDFIYELPEIPKKIFTKPIITMSQLHNLTLAQLRKMNTPTLIIYHENEVGIIYPFSSSLDTPSKSPLSTATSFDNTRKP